MLQISGVAYIGTSELLECPDLRAQDLMPKAPTSNHPETPNPKLHIYTSSRSGHGPSKSYTYLTPTPSPRPKEDKKTRSTCKPESSKSHHELKKRTYKKPRHLPSSHPSSSLRRLRRHPGRVCGVFIIRRYHIII